MGNIYFGDKAPKSIYWGSSSVKKIYYGSTLLWTSEVSFSLHEAQIKQSKLTDFVNDMGSYKFIKVKVVSGENYYDIYYADGTASTTGFIQEVVMSGSEYVTQFSPDYIDTIISSHDPHAIIYISMTAYAGEFYYDTSYPTWTENTAMAGAPLEAVNDIVYGIVGKDGDNKFLLAWISSGYGTDAAKVYEPTDSNDWPYRSALSNTWYLTSSTTLISVTDFLEGSPITDVLPGGTEEFVVSCDGNTIKVFIVI